MQRKWRGALLEESGEGNVPTAAVATVHYARPGSMSCKFVVRLQSIRLDLPQFAIQWYLNYTGWLEPRDLETDKLMNFSTLQHHDVVISICKFPLNLFLKKKKTLNCQFSAWFRNDHLMSPCCTFNETARLSTTGIYLQDKTRNIGRRHWEWLNLTGFSRNALKSGESAIPFYTIA